MDVFALPEQARSSIGRIEAMLADAERLLARGGATDEAAYALRETGARYLPDTLKAYLDIPASRRDATAADMLVAQLDLLERGTRDRLARLSESSERALASNGAFLSERFGALDPAASSAAPAAFGVRDDGAAAPAYLVRRFFDEVQAAGSVDERGLLSAVAAKFSAVFPKLTQVKRGLFGGDVAAVAIDVPTSGTDVMRYALERERTGIAASLTKIVRGIALRKEACAPSEWAELLLEDLSAYAERDRAASATLTKLFTR